MTTKERLDALERSYRVTNGQDGEFWDVLEEARQLLRDRDEMADRIRNARAALEIRLVWKEDRDERR